MTAASPRPIFSWSVCSWPPGRKSGSHTNALDFHPAEACVGGPTMTQTNGAAASPSSGGPRPGDDDSISTGSVHADATFAGLAILPPSLWSIPGWRLLSPPHARDIARRRACFQSGGAEVNRERVSASCAAACCGRWDKSSPGAQYVSHRRLFLHSRGCHRTS